MVFLVVASFFTKYSLKYWVKSFLSIIAGISAYFLFTELVLVFLDMLLVNAPLEIQPIIVIPSFIICGIVMTKISFLKKFGHT